MRNAIFKALWIVLPVLILAGRCEDGRDELVNGQLTNLKGLSGCGWVIQLDDGTKLEPLNLQEFETEPTEGAAVAVRYEIRQDISSNCMVGPIIKINDYKRMKNEK